MPARSPDIGDQDKPVTIEQATDSVDASGMPTQTWSTLLEGVWMSKEDLSGRERLTAQQVAAAYDSRWVMPYQSDMDPDVIDVPKDRRLVYRGRVHNITYATLTASGDGIELVTVAGTV